MRLLRRFLILLIIMMIPVISISAAGNIMTRLPDIYAYEFTKSQVQEAIGLDADVEKLSGLFSGYFTGGTAEFQIVAEYQGREKAVFTTAEQIGMQNVKKILDIALAAGALMAALSAAIIYFFISIRQKERIRSAFKISAVLFVALWVALIAAVMSQAGPDFLQGLFAGEFDPEGVLGMLLSGGFLKTWLIFNVIGSGILMFIIGMIVFRVTKERRMFVN